MTVFYSCSLLFNPALLLFLMDFQSGSHLFFFCCCLILCSSSPECACKCNIILVYSLSLVLYNSLSQTNVAIKAFSLKFLNRASSSFSVPTPSTSVSIWVPMLGFTRWFPVAMAASYWSVLSVEPRVKWQGQLSKRFPHHSTLVNPV